MELTSVSATTLARMIARKKCSAREALDAHVKRIAKFNPAINAVIAMQQEEAEAQAAKADEATAAGTSWGPLHGVPMTVKDTYNTIGMRTTIGLPWLKKHIPTEDAALVTKLRQAGAIVWGKTSLPFSSYDWQCKHPIAGRCHNPWDLAYSPGGSSGGSAAAVAAGFSPLELGSDVAGSIRQPAHSCGVYGMRTTEGLLHGAGHGAPPDDTPHALRSHISLGPLARDPEDFATILPHLLDATTPQGRQVMTLPCEKPLERTRIAWTPGWGGVPLCEDTKAALASLVGTLSDAGAHVEEVPLPFHLDEVFEAYGVSHGFEYAALLPTPLRNGLVKRLMRHIYQPFMFGRGAFSHTVGRGITASSRDYFTALDRRQHAMKAFDAWFARWDLWITPVAATTAFPNQRTGKSIQVAGERVSYCDAVGMFCCPTAALGHPIMSVPVGLSQAGLPIGLQLHARRWHDRQLVQHAIELAALLPPLALPKLSKTCASGLAAAS